jgi:hypothetical protein
MSEATLAADRGLARESVRVLGMLMICPLIIDAYVLGDRCTVVLYERLQSAAHQV